MTPLILHDGTKIDTITGEVIVDTVVAENGTASAMVQVPTHSEAVDVVMRTRRALTDLPDVAANMHPIAVIVAYEMFGLNTQDIAIALDSSVERVEAIRATSIYMEFKRAATNNLVEAHDDEIRGLLKQHASRAVGTVVRSLSSQNESTALNAAKDILDRGGHTPKQIVEHQHSMMNEMRIVHVDRQSVVPEHARMTIDVTPKKE